MEWQEALPLLQDNHTGVAISVEVAPTPMV